MPSLKVNLLLLLLIVVSCSSQFDGGEEHSKRIIKRNGLKEDGEHVCSYRDTISKLVNVSVEQETLRTVYKRKCNWLNICHNESKIIIVKVITYQLRTKYFDRDNLYCCDGWMRGRDASKECKQPICSISCQNGGKCVAPDTCECLDGFEGDYCQIDNNECMDPTKNNCEQTCINTDGGFRCACEEGYILDEDGKSCNDINECERKLDPPCKCEAIDGVCNSTCVNIPGRYRCSCSSGYELTSAEKCRDINECFLYPDICDQKCLNKPGSYECGCVEGYQYNGKKCVDIDECAIKNGNCSDNCINIDGSYVCTCPDGFYLTKDRKTCAVIEPDMTNMVVCQSDMIGELACKNYDEKLVIISAMYGRLSAKHCQNGNYTQNLRCKGADPTRYLRAACDNQQSCVIFLNEKKIFGDPCPGIEKYLQVTYLCMK